MPTLGPNSENTVGIAHGGVDTSRSRIARARPSFDFGSSSIWSLPGPVNYNLEQFATMSSAHKERLERASEGERAGNYLKELLVDGMTVPLLTYLACNAEMFESNLEPMAPRVKVTEHRLAVGSFWLVTNGFDHIKVSEHFRINARDIPKYLDEFQELIEGINPSNAVRKAYENGTLPAISDIPNISAAGRTAQPTV